MTATPCCAAAAPWPAQRSKIGGVQANAPLAEAGHLAIRCVRRSSPCVHGRRYAEPQRAAERILRGAVRGAQRCKEVHRQACTRAAPKRGGAIKRSGAGLWRRGAALPGVQNGAGGASLRRCGAARVAMRKRGAKHRAVRQHGGCA